MKWFLTSSLLIPNTEKINPANGFLDALKHCVPNPCKAVFVCSDPVHHEKTERFAKSIQAAFLSAGFDFSKFSILDSKNQEDAADLVSGAELIILAGGHVPTQNRFFAQVGLKNLLQSFGGVLIGISAGSMNCAEVVYAHPDLAGEAIDAAYQKYLPGLALTKKMILPHYQMIKHDMLDGLRVMEDIAYPDSRGKAFYTLVDGSYLYLDNGIEKICGEAYLITDGELSQISSLGNTVVV